MTDRKLRPIWAAVIAMGLGGGLAAWATAAGDNANDRAQSSAAVAGEESPGCVPAEKDPNRHANFMKQKERLLKRGPIELVFLGDSITDFWRRDDQRDIFEADFGKYNPYNTAISGDQTQHLLWRIDHGELDGIHPKVAVIMIGTNNLGHRPAQTSKQTADGVKCVVKAVQQKLPETKILLLAVFPRGMSATDPYRAQIKEVNEMISKLDDGGRHVKYLDINDKFLTPDGTLTRDIMPDALHPNYKGYEIWAQAMKPAIDELEAGKE
jgi:beta-glucosidase